MHCHSLHTLLRKCVFFIHTTSFILKQFFMLVNLHSSSNSLRFLTHIHSLASSMLLNFSPIHFCPRSLYYFQSHTFHCSSATNTMTAHYFKPISLSLLAYFNSFILVTLFVLLEFRNGLLFSIIHQPFLHKDSFSCEPTT